MITKRIVSRFLDEVIGVSLAVVGLVVTGVPAGFIYWMSTFSNNDIVSTIVGLVVGVPVASTFIYVYIWATAERASNNGQSVGMSIMKVCYVSDKKRLTNPLLKFIYRWVWIGQKENDGWAGNEQDDVGSLMLFRRFFTPFVVFSVSLASIAVGAVLRLPLALFNLAGGNIDLFSSVPLIDYPIWAVAAFILFLTLLGPFLIFTKQRKTLSDHFFGVQIVDAPSVQEAGTRANLWQWFWNK